jgi:hypothetical protein
MTRLIDATFLPPPVTPSDEEPIAAGGRQIRNNERRLTG